MKFRPFVDAKEYVRQQGLTNQHDIPSTPWHNYKKNWKGSGDWLGTGTIAPQKKKFRSFHLARNMLEH